MKEEVRRIMKLVQEGKLSAEDGAELIDAFLSAEGAESEDAGPSDQPSPPPPPPDAPGGARDPFKNLVDAIEKLGREATESVNWGEVSKQVRSSAKKGLDGLRVGVDQIKKGQFGWPWFSAVETRELTMPLGVSEGKTLRIENARGDIKVVGGFDAGSVTAKAHVRGNDPDEARVKAEEYTLILEESDSQVLIRQPDVSGLSVDLEVQLPTGVAMSVHAEAGDVSILDTGSGCRVINRSGDIHLRGLNGTIEVTSQSGDLLIEESATSGLVVENKSGDLRLKGLKGNLNARTASGNVSLDSCSGKTISVETVSGDVSADMPEAITGSLNVRTVNGSVDLGVMDGSDCRVALSTLRGSVTCELELQDEARSEGRITGHLGEGGGTLDASAVSGDISLKLRDSGNGG